MKEDYKDFLEAYVLFLENIILFETGKKPCELLYGFTKDVIDTLSKE